MLGPAASVIFIEWLRARLAARTHSGACTTARRAATHTAAGRSAGSCASTRPLSESSAGNAEN